MNEPIMMWLRYYLWLAWELICGSRIVICDPWLSHFVQITPGMFWEFWFQNYLAVPMLDFWWGRNELGAAVLNFSWRGVQL